MINSKLAANALDVAMHTEAMLAYWDSNLICRFANSSYLDWFGVKAEDMIDKMSISELLGDELYQKNKKFIDKVLEGVPQVFERLITTPQGVTKSSRATYKPDIVKGVVRGFYAHVTDVTPLDIPDAVTKNSKGKNILLSNADVMDKVVHVLKSNMLSTFPGIGSLAKKHFMSESKLKRDFKERYGKPIFSYYRSLQMELAHQYLSEKSYNKNQIAFILNFSNPSNFSQCYRRHLLEKKTKELCIGLENAVDEKYKTFIGQAPVTLAMIDTKFNFLAVSEKWEIDYGDFGEFIGKNLLDIMPDAKFSDVNLLTRCLVGHTNVCDEIFQEKSDGAPGWIRWDIRPWHNAQGEIGGLLILTEDITRIKLQNEEYRIINEILRKTNEISCIGTWTRSIRTGKVFYSDVLKHILEVPGDFVPSTTIPFDFFSDENTKTQVEYAIKNAINIGKPFDITVELLTAKGNTKKVFIAGYPEFYNERCEKIIGIIQEITVNEQVLLIKIIS
jgi:PAS domain S-box-containing protein